MKKDTIIRVEDVSICFNMSKEKVDNIKEWAIKLVKHQLHFEEFWALKGINLNIRRGESVGLIGSNGSGKSTLLKVMAGVLKPTKGTLTVEGSIAPLIELGAGFDQDLTARENIFLNGAILGYSKEKMEEFFDDIVEFSELRDFLDVPVKNFSSGMFARLGFAIATIVRPDILICDEILAVGDFKFQEKCKKRILDMKKAGTTILFVSHSTGDVQKICEKAAWIKQGNLVMYGDAEQVCAAYESS